MESGRRKGIHHEMVKSTTRGLLLAVLSGIFYSIMTVLVKCVTTLHPAQLVVYRYWAVTSLALPQLIFSEENHRCPPSSRFYILLLAIANPTSAVFVFIAYRYLPFGEAVTMISSYPAFVTIAGRMILKESFGLLQVFALVITIIGLMFVTGLCQAIVTNSRVYTTEDIYGLGAGIMAIFGLSATILLLRKLRNIHHSFILVSSGIVGVIEAMIVTYLLDSFRIHYKGLQQVFIILLGVAGYLANITYVMAAHYTDAGPVSIIEAGTEIILAFVWQVILFRDAPGPLTVFGAVLVGISVFLTGLSNKINGFFPAKCINFC